MNKSHINIGLIGTVMAMAVAGCLNSPASDETLAFNGGKQAAAVAADSGSKSSALGQIVVNAPDAPPQAINAGKAIVIINGPARPADVEWARKITATDEALAKANKGLTQLAADNAALIDRLAHSISPEDAQKLKDQAAQVQATLDAFTFHVKCAVLVGFLIIIACGLASWLTDNIKYALYGLGGSFCINLLPFIVKAVAESLALKIAIPLGFIAIGGGIWYEWRKGIVTLITVAPPVPFLAATAPVVSEVVADAKVVEGRFSRAWNWVKSKV